MKIAVVYSDFYTEISDGLRDGVRKAANEFNFELVEYKVFGAMEIPLKVKQLLRLGYDGFVVLGCIMKGETISNEVISYSVNDALLNISLDSEIPIGFAILTVDNLQQALVRCTGASNRGYEAVQAIYFSQN